MHTRSGRGFTRELTLAAQHQQAIDQDFNERALQAGFSVLRLHYLNRPVCSQIVFTVVKACRDRSFRNRIAFSQVRRHYVVPSVYGDKYFACQDCGWIEQCLVPIVALLYKSQKVRVQFDIRLK